jgi:hypothetical protein
MKALYFFLAICCLLACSQHEDTHVVEVNLIPDAVVLKEEPKFYNIDSSDNQYRLNKGIRKLRCGLYIDKDGNLFYRAETKSDPFYVYINKVWLNNDDLDEDVKDLRYIIDTFSFELLEPFYFKDKKHVYHFQPMMEGGIIGIIINTHPKSFHLLESKFYAKDKNHCYYRGYIIEQADATSFSILDTAYSMHIAKDKNHYYSGGEIMQASEKKEINLDSLLRRRRQKANHQ